MSWALFIDESGQDQRESPYEVLAGIAVEDRRIWPLIRQISDLQQHTFGMRLFEAYGKEAKAKQLLTRPSSTPPSCRVSPTVSAPVSPASSWRTAASQRGSGSQPSPRPSSPTATGC